MESNFRGTWRPLPEKLARFRCTGRVCRIRQPFQPVHLLKPGYRGSRRSNGSGSAGYGQAIAGDRPHRATGEQAAHVVEILNPSPIHPDQPASGDSLQLYRLTNGMAMGDESKIILSSPDPKGLYWGVMTNEAEAAASGWDDKLSASQVWFFGGWS